MLTARMHPLSAKSGHVFQEQGRDIQAVAGVQFSGSVVSDSL